MSLPKGSACSRPRSLRRLRRASLRRASTLTFLLACGEDTSSKRHPSCYPHAPRMSSPAVGRSTQGTSMTVSSQAHRYPPSTSRMTVPHDGHDGWTLWSNPSLLITSPASHAGWLGSRGRTFQRTRDLRWGGIHGKWCVGLLESYLKGWVSRFVPTDREFPPDCRPT